MIKFDITKLSVQMVQLKAITTSLGGSISVIDKARTTATKEVCTRVRVPMSTARDFIMKTKKVTKYLKPVNVALVNYDGHIIAMERDPLASFGTLKDEFDSGREWVPHVVSNIEMILRPLMTLSSREWYFDGRYAYSFDAGAEQAVRNGDYLTSDGRFRKVLAQSIDTQELDNRDKLAAVQRSCMAFVSSRGEFAISPPIWKNLSAVGMTQLSKAGAVQGNAEDGDDEEDSDALDVPEQGGAKEYNFDKIDEHLSVNLNFALKAGQEIGKTFGYEHVEPLQLPRLMIELHTVNLPNVPPQIKSTYAAGIQFTHALSWLLGLSRKANTLETYIMMRSLMKYLTKRGIFRANVFNAEQVFKDDKNVNDVPVMSLDQLLEDQDFTKLSLGMILEQARQGMKARKKSTEITQIGGMLTEE